jgi:hypothetical protein
VWIDRGSAMHTSALVGLGVCLALCATNPSVAQERPNTAAMPCRAAAALVSASGAIVLSTGPSTYDRYVNGDRYCQRDEVSMPAFVRSADNPQCFIGYYCISRPVGTK